MSLSRPTPLGTGVDRRRLVLSDVGTGSEIHFLAPTRVEIQREDPLDGLGAPGSGLDERIEGLPELAEPRVGVLAVPRRRTVDPIEDRGDLQDLAPRLEEVVIQDLGGVARVEHDSRPSSTRWLAIHHRKTSRALQTG